MEIGFLIPTYLLIIYTYAWWVYARIVWVNAFSNSDMVFYLWLALLILFHIGIIRTINSRYGYTKDSFKAQNFYGQWVIYLLGFPVVFLDWKCMRNFSFYIARAWEKFWVIFLLLKVGAIASVWAVLGYYLDRTNQKQLISVNFVFGFTVITFMNHPWIMKLWLLIIYFFPFIVYIIAKIIIYPFTFCLCWWFWIKRRAEDSGEYDSRSNRSDVVNEGGEYDGNEEYQPDINNLDSARDLQSSRSNKSSKPKTKKKKKVKTKSKAKSKPKSAIAKDSKLPADLENQKESKNTENLETNGPMEENGDKGKKKIKRKKASKKEKEGKGDQNTKDLDSLNFFSRAWRCLKPRYCEKCKRMIKVHQPEMQWSVGHWLHSKCAHVKWIGNNVCPLWVKEPLRKPIEVRTQIQQIEHSVEEEVEESEHYDGPMKPNQI